MRKEKRKGRNIEEKEIKERNGDFEEEELIEKKILKRKEEVVKNKSEGRMGIKENFILIGEERKERWIFRKKESGNEFWEVIEGKKNGKIEIGGKRKRYEMIWEVEDIMVEVEKGEGIEWWRVGKRKRISKEIDWKKLNGSKLR